MVFPLQGPHLLRLLLRDSFFRKRGPKFSTQKMDLRKGFCLFTRSQYRKIWKRWLKLCEKLNDFTVKSLKVVLEQVFAEHNKDMPVKYSLNASAREAFFKFAKPQELDLTSSQGTPRLTCTNSKRNKHVLRVALNMDIFYDRLKFTCPFLCCTL